MTRENPHMTRAQVRASRARSIRREDAVTAMAPQSVLASKINDKGQCPHCRIKPLVYKREPHLFCHRCDRAFHPATGLQIANWAFRSDDGGETFYRKRAEGKAL